jgi:Predicted dehydrogenases and related proteins
MDNVRFGILGYGNMGTSHSLWLVGGKVPGAALCAVCDINPARLEVAATNCPGVALFSDPEEFMASHAFDALIIAVPHYDHPRYAIEAMKQGYHVMCEKPAGILPDDIKKMNAEAESHPELSTAMMLNQRINPLYQKVKKLLDDKEIGDIRRVTWHITTWWRTQKYYDSSAWRATWRGEGGGVLVNQAPHQLDLITWLFGTPSMVHAFIKYGSHRAITVDDDVTAYFEWPNGATGTLVTCTFDPLGTDRLEILGNRGKIIIENGSTVTVKKQLKSEEQLNAELDFRQVLALVHGQGSEKLNDEYSFEMPEHWDIQHIDTLINFVENIREGKSLIAPLTEGLHAVEFASGMYLSSWTGKDVALPVDDKLFRSLLEERIAGEKK